MGAESLVNLRCWLRPEIRFDRDASARISSLSFQSHLPKQHRSKLHFHTTYSIAHPPLKSCTAHTDDRNTDSTQSELQQQQPPQPKISQHTVTTLRPIPQATMAIAGQGQYDPNWMITHNISMECLTDFTSKRQLDDLISHGVFQVGDRFAMTFTSRGGNVRTKKAVSRFAPLSLPIYTQSSYFR